MSNVFKAIRSFVGKKKDETEEFLKTNPTPVGFAVKGFTQPVQKAQDFLQQSELARINYNRESEQGDVYKRLIANPVTRYTAEPVGQIAGEYAQSVKDVIKSTPPGQFIQRLQGEKPTVQQAMSTLRIPFTIAAPATALAYRAFPAVYGAGGGAEGMSRAVVKNSGPSELAKNIPVVGDKLAPGTTGGNILDASEIALGLMGKGLDDKALGLARKLPNAKGFVFGKNSNTPWSSDESSKLTDAVSDLYDNINIFKKPKTEYDADKGNELLEAIDQKLTSLANDHLPTNIVEKLSTKWGSNTVGYLKDLSDALQDSLRKYEDKGGIVLGFAETPKIKSMLKENLKSAEGPDQAAEIVREFSDGYINGAGEKELKALRAALNQELSGDGKTLKSKQSSYAEMKNNPELSPYADAIEETIRRIDDVLNNKTVTPQAAKVITEIKTPEDLAQALLDTVPGIQKVSMDQDPIRVPLTDTIKALEGKYTLNKSIVKSLNDGDILDVGSGLIVKGPNNTLQIRIPNEFGVAPVKPVASAPPVVPSTPKGVPLSVAEVKAEPVQNPTGVPLSTPELPSIGKAININDPSEAIPIGPQVKRKGGYIEKQLASEEDVMQDMGTPPTPPEMLYNPKGKPVTESQFNKSMKELEKNLEETYQTTKATNRMRKVAVDFPADTIRNAPTVDKPAFLYMRETLPRNLEDTFGREQGQKIKSYFYEPIVANETKATQWKNDLKTSLGKTFKDLGINKGSKEDFAVGDYIEGKLTAEQLQEQFPQTYDKVIQAAEEGRKVYKLVLQQINDEITKYGYEPIQPIGNYITHTKQIDEVTSLFGNFAGIAPDKLPTFMSGINADTNPGKQFFGFGLERRGGATHEGIITALEKYIEPAANQIFHTADIQRGRAIQDYIKQLTEGSQTRRLSNFNSYFSSYVNSLSGKKDWLDRVVEKYVGRSALSLFSSLKRKVGANQVGGNIASAITNFIPMTQSLATTDKESAVRGIFSASTTAMKNPTEVDGIASGFLTRRFPVERISNTWRDNVDDMARWLFKSVDKFTSHSIVAGKYFEGIKDGLTKEQAMNAADEFASRVMADRSFGQVPLLFNSQTFGSLTQFQVEVNNQLSFLFKDIPKNFEFDKGEIASAFAQVALYSYVFNEVFQKITGRRPAIDPINASITLAEDVVAGESFGSIIDPTDSNSPVGQIVNNLPFASIPAGGRLPIQGALPDVAGVIQGTTTLPKELAKPASLLLPPTGGGQIKKTIEGISAFGKGYEETAGGRIKYPIEQDLANLVRAFLFGKGAFPETGEYYSEDRNSLGEGQSESFKALGPEGRGTYYNQIQRQRDMKNGKTTTGIDLFPKAYAADGLQVQNTLPEPGLPISDFSKGVSFAGSKINVSSKKGKKISLSGIKKPSSPSIKLNIKDTSSSKKSGTPLSIKPITPYKRKKISST